MITYTIIADNYFIMRNGKQSITFNENAADLWETYEKWLEEGNTPSTSQNDPFVLVEHLTEIVTN